jgi:hypothetical protein
MLTIHKETDMKRIYKSGAVEIWEIKEAYGSDFYVYGVTNSGDPIVCPSLDMAHAKAAR